MNASMSPGKMQERWENALPVIEALHKHVDVNLVLGIHILKATSPGCL